MYYQKCLFLLHIIGLPIIANWKSGYLGAATIYTQFLRCLSKFESFQFVKEDTGRLATYLISLIKLEAFCIMTALPHMSRNTFFIFVYAY